VFNFALLIPIVVTNGVGEGVTFGGVVAFLSLVLVSDSDAEFVVPAVVEVFLFLMKRKLTASKKRAR
jgi:hypothetical protein